MKLSTAIISLVALVAPVAAQSGSLRKTQTYKAGQQQTFGTAGQQQQTFGSAGQQPPFGAAAPQTFGSETKIFTRQAGRVVGWVQSWNTCPTKAQIAHYTHLIVGYATTQSANSCTVLHPTVCVGGTGNEVAEWQMMGKKVLLGFGGPGFGAENLAQCIKESGAKLGQELASVAHARNYDGVSTSLEGLPTGPNDPALKFVLEYTVALRQGLGPNKILVHSPHGAQLQTQYADILRSVADHVNFVIIQFYNYNTNPAKNGLEGTGPYCSGKCVAVLPTYDAVVKGANGDASRVVFAFCGKACGIYNTPAATAGTIMKELDQKFPCNGGAALFAVNGDTDGSYGAALASAATTPCTF